MKVLCSQESILLVAVLTSKVSSFSSWLAGPHYTVQHLAIMCRCASSWWSRGQLYLR